MQISKDILSSEEDEKIKKIAFHFREIMEIVPLDLEIFPKATHLFMWPAVYDGNCWQAIKKPQHARNKIVKEEF